MKQYQFVALLIGLSMSASAFSAAMINLNHQPSKYLQFYFSAHDLAENKLQFKKIRSDTDFNHMTHTRYQQLYNGFPIWNATSVVHIPEEHFKNHTKTTAITANGIIYKNLEQDLATVSLNVFSPIQKTKALEQAKVTYSKNMNLQSINFQQESVKPIVYVNEKKQARYAFLISFYVDDGKTGIHIPTVIMDADTFHIYDRWDQVMNVNIVTAGGIGGNEKTGEIIYDGGNGHPEGFKVYSYPEEKSPFSSCYLWNEDIVIKDAAYLGTNVFQHCLSQIGKHNDVAWLDWDANETRWKHDEVNGGYSPSLDAFYAATLVKKLYQEWYGIPVWTKEDGKTPVPIEINVHYGRDFENAMFIIDKVIIGDGKNLYYPLTAVDVVTHEINHGFTWQHSNIGWPSKQMAALNESFSDMAAMAAQFYLTGTNDWKIGSTIIKQGDALRYIDDPKKDGKSIDNLKDYTDAMDVHYAMGIFNKAFYLIATSNGWNTRKAFDVMVKANMHYWTSSMQTMTEAACGVISATKDYNYNVDDITAAFSKVGIETTECK